MGVFTRPRAADPRSEKRFLTFISPPVLPGRSLYASPRGPRGRRSRRRDARGGGVVLREQDRLLDGDDAAADVPRPGPGRPGRRDRGEDACAADPDAAVVGAEDVRVDVQPVGVAAAAGERLGPDPGP